MLTMFNMLFFNFATPTRFSCGFNLWALRHSV